MASLSQWRSSPHSCVLWHCCDFIPLCRTVVRQHLQSWGQFWAPHPNEQNVQGRAMDVEKGLEQQKQLRDLGRGKKAERTQEGTAQPTQRTTMLLGSMDSTASRNLNCTCWYSRWCSKVKCCTPLRVSSSCMVIPAGCRGDLGTPREPPLLSHSIKSSLPSLVHHRDTRVFGNSQRISLFFPPPLS